MAIKCKWKEKDGEKPAILFASDTQESSLFLKSSVTKIKAIIGNKPNKYDDPWNILVASAGDALVVDEVFSDIRFYLMDNIEPDRDAPSIGLSVFRKNIGDIAYTAYKKYKDRGISNPTFELLLGAADKFSNILNVTYEGKTQIIDQFGIIGTGRITGGELLLNELFKTDMTYQEAAHLASFIITVVGHCDISVGGKPDIRICGNRIAWIFTDPAFQNIMVQTGSRWELTKRAWWKMQEDKTLEERIKELLK